MRLLIIRPGAIGDTLLTLPVLEALRATYSDAHITLVGNSAVLPLALASGLVEKVSDYGHLQWSELFSTEGIHTPALQEQLEETDLAICWLRSPDGVVERNLGLAGVKRIIVAAGRPAEGRRIHVVDYLAETVGLTGISNVLKRSLLALPAVTSSAQKGSLHHKQAPVAIHPGSGGAEKCWPVYCYVAVIERLWEGNYPVLLLAGPADTERINELQSRLSAPPGQEMLSVLIEEPLEVVAEHLLQCRCYLGNDSGITHLAAMLGVPTTVLFGPSDPAIWRPLGSSVEILQAQVLERVSVDEVMESILRHV